MFPNSYEQIVLEDPGFPVIFHQDFLNDKSNFLTHWHENIEILYFRKGTGVVYCDTVPVYANAGNTVVVNTCVLHSIHSVTPDCYYDCLIIDKQFFEKLELPFEESRFGSLVEDEDVQNHFDKIVREVSSKNPYYKIAVKAEVLSLIARLFRIALQAPIAREDRISRRLDMVRAAIIYIRRHYKEELTVDEICSRVGFSKYYFCRVFREITGKTVVETINFLRCSHARGLLLTGRCNVSESAERSGFHNLSYFSRTYKRHMGELPSETGEQ